MARIRTIKPEFWDDEAVGLLSREARLLFIATWNLADDEGLLRWAASYVKASVFMYDEDVSIADSQRIMGELESAGLVYPYRGGKAQQQLAYVVNFRKHQKINRPQPGKLPPPSIQNPDVRRMYARRDNWVCALCSQAISEQRTQSELDWGNTDWALSLDHRDPRSNGGSDYPSNIQIAHRRCNSARGARPLPDEPLTESLTEPLSESDVDVVSEPLPLDVVPDSVVEGEGKEGKGGDGRGSGSAVALRDDRADAERLCTHLADRIEGNGVKRPAITTKWREAARLMLDRDKRPEAEIHAAIDWCQAHEFWRSNVLSMPKLREQYDRLRLQAEREHSDGRSAHSTTNQRVAAGAALIEKYAREEGIA